jgi:hypothetical protein
MAMPNFWMIWRMVLIIAGVPIFGQAIYANTNFDAIAGLVCGVVSFFLVLFAVAKYSIAGEEIFNLTSPRWPPSRYPQAYWSTTGAILVVAGVVNLAIHFRVPAALKLYLGFSLFGVGIFAGAVLARYRFVRKEF